ncbi:MAG: hypothetical protein PHR68_05485 [Candidatus Gracilibacteria bacterium]|nr:hypothetical protein [Candidatus Gracilibacteria bacterium]
MSNNNSRELDSHLDSFIPESLETKLASLKALSIDPTAFSYFHERIENILGKNPGSEGFIETEVGKLSLAFENMNYSRKFKSILLESANNPDFNPGFNPDENYIA